MISFSASFNLLFSACRSGYVCRHPPSPPAATGKLITTEEEELEEEISEMNLTLVQHVVLEERYTVSPSLSEYLTVEKSHTHSSWNIYLPQIES